MGYGPYLLLLAILGDRVRPQIVEVSVDITIVDYFLFDLFLSVTYCIIYLRDLYHLFALGWQMVHVQTVILILTFLILMQNAQVVVLLLLLGLGARHAICGSAHPRRQ